ncbi:MAG: heparinase [Phycisphaerae bacterium]|nr:heparinase [Phycisphaerae bacterium]
MQSLNWYVRRLRAMSLGEIAWRIHGAAVVRADRLLLSRRQGLEPLERILRNGDGAIDPPCRVCGVAVGEASAVGYEDAWRDALVATADRIVEHRLSYFDQTDRHLGDPIDWNRDHKRGQPSPLVFAPSIDYRDVRETGDCKFVWEPNRHHQMVVLGRAYRATGELRYAQAVVDQIDGWLRACPYGLGMNWRSPLELGLRLINWVWALDLIREAELVRGEFRHRLFDSVHRHLWEIARKYSRGSSANNHIIGEAAGVFVAASYFDRIRNASAWADRALRIVYREMLGQTYADGGTREQAASYHIFVLQFLLAVRHVALRTGRTLPDGYDQRLERIFEFIAELLAGGRHLPMFGDADDGYVLDLSSHPRDPRQWLAVGALLFDRADFAAVADEFPETAFWLAGPQSRANYENLRRSNQPILRPRAFADSGTYLLQHAGGDHRVSVVFDCGEHGYHSIAAHAHADALSFVLRLDGRDLLVDPGTYDYFTFPEWRNYFRGTRAHNTAAVDGCDQSELLGLFLWGRRAQSKCLEWDANDRGGRIVAEHDGYARLTDPVIHRRTLDLNGPEGRLMIRDGFTARESHRVEICFHFAEEVQVAALDGNRFAIELDQVSATLILDPRLVPTLIHAPDQPVGGWVSRGYHRKTPSTSLFARAGFSGPTEFLCELHTGGHASR